MSTVTTHHVSTLAPVVRLRPQRQQAVRPSGQVRLTRRGRAVVLVFALLVVFAAFVALGGGSVATDEPGTPPATEVIQVTEGQTLWGIASERAEGGDIREVMREVERLNALESGMLGVGQKLRVPAGD